MRYLFLFISLVTLSAPAQIIDNFTDNNFTTNPVWSGDTSEFIINVSQQLQLNSTTTGTSYLSTPSPSSLLANTEWSFYIKQSFAPSSNNYGKFYLASDQSNLEGLLNGYYLRFGESGNTDAVELFRQTGSTSISIARATNGQIATSFEIGVKVTRNASGNWNLYIDPSGGNAYALESSGTDNTYTTTNFFGITATYTTSNSTDFYFDDFYNGPITVDTTSPAIISSTTISNIQVDLLFTEAVDLVTSQMVTNYSANNGLGNPSFAIRDANNPALVHLTFSTNFTNELINTLTINNILDYSGNSIMNATTDFSYFVIKPFDIVINEILFDPKDDGVDFVELYNCSNKVIDLKTMRLSQYDTTSGTLINIENISTDSYLIFPKDYLVLSENGNIIKKQYHTTNNNGFLDMAHLPAMNVDDGIICLSTATEIIDQFKYDVDMHFAILNETKGVSLERINFYRPTHERTNWHSAAASVGYATPAYKNSQYTTMEETDNLIEITPEVFSPDEDGFNDVVNISYHFDTSGFVGNIIIYDSKGRMVKPLIRNELLGIKGTFSWDGVNTDREKASIGIYIIYFEVFDLSGNVKHYKKTCVLASKL